MRKNSLLYTLEIDRYKGGRMGFNSGGGGSSAISGATDVALSNPLNGQVLSYDSTSTKWRNTVGGSGSSFTASKDTAASGSIVLTPGSSAQLVKLAGSLSANRTITLSGTTQNAVFEISLIDLVFNGFSITLTNGIFSHTFSYATYVKYVYISGWERVM